MKKAKGLPAPDGAAYAARLDGKKHRVFCIIGDGESDEGQIWEAAMSSAHYRLDNLCILVDANGLQIDGEVAKVMNVEPIADKFRAVAECVVLVFSDQRSPEQRASEAAQAQEAHDRQLAEQAKGASPPANTNAAPAAPAPQQSRPAPAGPGGAR